MSFKSHNYFLGNIPHDSHFSNISSQRTVTTSIITNAINKINPINLQPIETETTNYLTASPDKLLQTVIDKASDLYIETKQKVIIYAFPGEYKDINLNIKEGISIISDHPFANLNLVNLTLNGLVGLKNITINVYNIHLESEGLGLYLENCLVFVVNDVSLDVSLLSSVFITMKDSSFGNEQKTAIKNTGAGMVNVILINSKLYGKIDISAGSGQLNFKSSLLKAIGSGISITGSSLYLIIMEECRFGFNINLGNSCELQLLNCIFFENLVENNIIISGTGTVKYANLISEVNVYFNITSPGEIRPYQGQLLQYQLPNPPSFS